MNIKNKIIIFIVFIVFLAIIYIFLSEKGNLKNKTSESNLYVPTVSEPPISDLDNFSKYLITENESTERENNFKKLNKPTNLRYTISDVNIPHFNANRINLFWNHNNENDVSYKIYMYSDNPLNGCEPSYTLVSAEFNKFRFNENKNGDIKYIRIRALNKYAMSDFSDIIKL